MARTRSLNCNTRLILLTVGMCSLYLATMFIIVGLTTNFWLELRDRNVNNDDVEAHFGLHRTCYTSSDKCSNPSSNYDEKDALPAVRTLVCIGAFLAVIATGVSMVNFAFDRLGVTNLKITIGAIIISALTGLFVLISCILFAAKVEIDPDLIMYPDNIYKGYSFGLTTTAGCLSCVSGLLFTWSAFLKAAPKFELS